MLHWSFLFFIGKHLTVSRLKSRQKHSQVDRFMAPLAAVQRWHTEGCRFTPGTFLLLISSAFNSSPPQLNHTSTHICPHFSSFGIIHWNDNTTTPLSVQWPSLLALSNQRRQQHRADKCHIHRAKTRLKWTIKKSKVNLNLRQSDAQNRCFEFYCCCSSDHSKTDLWINHGWAN